MIQRLFGLLYGIVATTILSSTSAIAETQLCTVLDELTSSRSAAALKKSPATISSWSTDFTLNGFDTCQIFPVADSDPRMWSTDRIECSVWSDNLDWAGGIRDRALASLTCGREVFSIPAVSEHGKSLFVPETGLALFANVELRDHDFTYWRRDLLEGDARTSPYIYRISVSISGVFPKQ